MKTFLRRVPSLGKAHVGFALLPGFRGRHKILTDFLTVAKRYDRGTPTDATSS